VLAEDVTTAIVMPNISADLYRDHT